MFVPGTTKSGSVKSVRLLDQNWAIWNSEGKPVVQLDRCPHRGARLSQGRVIGSGTRARLECPYHGWQFEASGSCVSIPQARSPASFYPKACSATTGRALVHDGILWMGTQAGASDASIPYDIEWLGNDDVWVTDRLFDSVPYNAWIQIENLLDPAHIHFVHDGFQGRRKRAGPMQAKLLADNDQEIAAIFQHDRAPGEPPSVPDIMIRYYMPSVVDVSILNSQNQIVRKNIIYVAPMDQTHCHVLFRDIAFKKYIYPDKKTQPILRTHLDEVVDRLIGKQQLNQSYDAINKHLIDQIMQQDVHVLKGQQENLLGSYSRHRMVLPTESDLLIVLFRRWLKKQKKVESSVNMQKFDGSKSF